ncbi:MAG: DUF98 domain-containing protein, partial [Magnetococcales bacterium]|nr:DUF98 domain-containing protein [Magnetococcales bacterium]
EACEEHAPWPQLQKLSSHRSGTATHQLIRDAWLLTGGKRLIFAHSQITLDGLPPTLTDAIQQGTLPLGTLFLDQYASVARQDLLLSRATAPVIAAGYGLPEETPLWCRHSLFHVDDTPRARILELIAHTPEQA